MNTIWMFLKGKKTYIVGVATIIVGLSNKDTTTVMLGLGMLGLRSAIADK